MSFINRNYYISFKLIIACRVKGNIVTTGFVFKKMEWETFYIIKNTFFFSFFKDHIDMSDCMHITKKKKRFGNGFLINILYTTQFHHIFLSFKFTLYHIGLSFERKIYSTYVGIFELPYNRRNIPTNTVLIK